MWLQFNMEKNPIKSMSITHNRHVEMAFDSSEFTHTVKLL